jgi:hypothetical protein
MVAPARSTEFSSRRAESHRPRAAQRAVEVEHTVNRYGSVSLGQHIVRAAEILAAPAPRRVTMLACVIASKGQRPWSAIPKFLDRMSRISWRACVAHLLSGHRILSSFQHESFSPMPADLVKTFCNRVKAALAGPLAPPDQGRPSAAADALGLRPRRRGSSPPDGARHEEGPGPPRSSTIPGPVCLGVVAAQCASGGVSGL